MARSIQFRLAARIAKGAAVLFGDERDGRREYAGHRHRYAVDQADEKGTVPVVDVKGVVGRHSQANTEGPAILLAPSFGGFRIEWIEEPSCILETCHFVDRTCTDHDLRYLFHFLRLAGALSETTRPSFVPGNLDDLGRLRVPMLGPDAEAAVAARIDAAETSHSLLETALDRMKALLHEKRRSATADAFGLDSEMVAEIGVLPGT